MPAIMGLVVASAPTKLAKEARKELNRQKANIICY